eukprot:COSAG06_NODE_2134_length_7517_cov_52.273928_1_plen_40_part_00
MMPPQHTECTQCTCSKRGQSEGGGEAVMPPQHTVHAVHV